MQSPLFKKDLSTLDVAVLTQLIKEKRTRFKEQTQNKAVCLAPSYTFFKSSLTMRTP